MLAGQVLSCATATAATSVRENCFGRPPRRRYTMQFWRSTGGWPPAHRSAPKGNAMAKNLYVGNLTWDATADDLLGLFQQHGVVAQAQVITDRETGRSRGFAFVEMSDDAEAQKAIEALNGADFQGRPLTVNEARPREERGGGGGGDRGRRY